METHQCYKGSAGSMEATSILDVHLITSSATPISLLMAMQIPAHFFRKTCLMVALVKASTRRETRQKSSGELAEESIWAWIRMQQKRVKCMFLVDLVLVSHALASIPGLTKCEN